MKHWITILFLFFSLSGTSFASSDLDHARGIIGILPLPEVFGSGPCDRSETHDIELFGTSRSSKNIGRIYVSKPWTFHPQGGCEGFEVAVSISEPLQRDERLPTLEFSYENPGAIVLEREGHWFKIALIEGYAWVHIKDDERYLPVEKLFIDALTYLNGQIQLPLLESPGQGRVIWSPGPDVHRNLPVEVLDFKEVSDKLWIKVKLLEVEPCTEEMTDVPTAIGWLPFHDQHGIPVIWFFSRGC